MQVLVTAGPGGITGFCPGLGPWCWALAETQATVMFTRGGGSVLGHLVGPGVEGGGCGKTLLGNIQFSWGDPFISLLALFCLRNVSILIEGSFDWLCSV